MTDFIISFDKLKISEKEAEEYIDDFYTSMLFNTKKYIGSLELNKLQSDYFREKKSANLRDFHSEILQEGCIPIPLLKRVMLD